MDLGTISPYGGKEVFNQPGKLDADPNPDLFRAVVNNCPRARLLNQTNETNTAGYDVIVQPKPAIGSDMGSPSRF